MTESETLRQKVENLFNPFEIKNSIRSSASAFPRPAQGDTGSVNLPPPDISQPQEAKGDGTDRPGPNREFRFPSQAIDPAPAPPPNSPNPSRQITAAPKQHCAPKKPAESKPIGKSPTPPSWFGEAADPARFDEVLSIGALQAIMGNAVSANVARTHMESVVSKASDPVERMLLESFVILHYQAMLNGIRAADPGDGQRAERYHNMMVRLTEKQQALATTISRYRDSSLKRRNSSIKNQNFAFGDCSNDPKHKISPSDQGELKGNAYGATNIEPPVDQAQEPKTDSSRNNQRTLEATVAA